MSFSAPRTPEVLLRRSHHRSDGMCLTSGDSTVFIQLVKVSVFFLVLAKGSVPFPI